MHTPKQMTKAQRHELLQKMKQDSIRFMGEPSALDEILPLFNQITDFIEVETKALKSRSPKVRERAERRILEVGGFFMQLMERLHPVYLSLLWKIEHALSAK